MAPTGEFLLKRGEVGRLDSPAAEQQSLASAAELTMRRYFNRHLADRFTQRLWRWRLLPPLLKQTLKYAPSLKLGAGMSVRSLFKDAWGTCIREECWPDSYFKFQLYREDRKPFVSRFVHERIGLYVMKDLNDHDDVAILDDKLEFAAACARLGLPHVETIAYFRDGEIVEKQTPGTALPREDLFIKSTNLLCGRGVQRWRYDASTNRYQHDGESLDAKELIEQLRARSGTGEKLPLWRLVRSHVPRLQYGHEREDAKPRPYIVQRELKNHPLMRRFTNGALCTVRVVTARAAGGEPQLIIAALRMPVGNSSVDNFAAGGLASPIDLETGRLGPAVYKDPRKADVDHHPDSRQQIAGEVVPFWNEVLDLCLRAHRCFPKVATVGWDVALTTEGPKLIEANPGWCVEVVQMAHGKPLGETAWPELLMSHARQ